MRRIAIFAGCTAVLFVHLPAAHAQRLTVQEPTLETFGVATTVSVPDRGRMHVAGSGRSASSRSMFGPIRSGTNMGLASQAAGLGVGVRIHDKLEMDRNILNAAERTRTTRDKVDLSKSADHAYETLRSRAAARKLAESADGATATVATRSPDTRPGAPADEGPSAQRLLDRARQAESNGKRELALAFLRSARDLGASEAHSEIERLSRKRK